MLQLNPYAGKRSLVSNYPLSVILVCDECVVRGDRQEGGRTQGIG